MRTTIVALAVLLCLVGVLAADEEPEDVLARAERAVAEGRPEEAVAALEAALDDDLGPDVRAPLAAALGRLFIAQAETYAALQWLEAAATDRGLPEDHLAFAAALLAVGRTNAASGAGRWMDVGPYLEDAVVAAERVPADETEAGRRRALLVGEARYWLGDPEGALAAWGEEDFAPAEGGLVAAEADRLRDLAARANYAFGRHTRAAELFRAGGNQRGEASAWAAAGEGSRALAVYANLLAAAPGDRAVLREAYDTARYTGAEAELAGILAGLEVEGADLAAVLTVRGRLSEASGAPEAAARLFAKAVAAAPQDVIARYELGRIGLIRAAGDPDARDRATASLIEALHLAPTREEPRSLLWRVAGDDYAAAWRSSRALDRSVRIQQALVDVDPEDGLAWANLGNTLRIAGRHEEALMAYDHALEAEPGEATVVSDRGLVLSALGRTQDALAAFETALRIDPDYDAAHQNAARLLWRAGRDDEAARHLAEAEASTRAADRGWMRYRFLQDRIWRTVRQPSLR